MQGLLIFHQGWTDIVNCLPLINYYTNIFELVYLLIREDSKDLIEYYTSHINNLKILYGNYQTGYDDVMECINSHKDTQNIRFLFHGLYDNFRIDNYKNRFQQKMELESPFFVEYFYSSYDIDYITRVKDFEFIRDYELENIIYQEFINKNGTRYILYHSDCVYQKITNYLDNTNYIDLNQISMKFFDYIKVLENSIELHLLDSVWAAIVYLLDTKYKLFCEKKVYVYCLRGYQHMFTNPIKLDNWNIIVGP